MADPDKSKKRAYGQLVVKALEDLAVPSTLTNIIEWVVNRTPGDPVELVQSVRNTIAKGITLGFIDALQRRYFLTSNRVWNDHDTSITIAAVQKRALEGPDRHQSMPVAEPEADEPTAKRPRVAFREGSAKATPKKLFITKNKKKKQRRR